MTDPTPEPDPYRTASPDPASAADPASDPRRVAPPDPYRVPPPAGGPLPPPSMPSSYPPAYGDQSSLRVFPQPYGDQPDPWPSAYQQYPGHPSPGPTSAPTPYSVPAYGAPRPWTPPRPRGLSITSMVLGIGSIVFAWVALLIPVVTAAVPIAGLVLGIMGLRREPAGRGFAITGIWTNSIVLGIGLIVLLGFLALIALGLWTVPAGIEEPPNA